jgi:hypothetical protein
MYNRFDMVLLKLLNVLIVCIHELDIPNRPGKISGILYWRNAQAAISTILACECL